MPIQKAGLPEPRFEEYQGFRVIFNKDIYTEEYLRKFGLNERQIKAVMYVKEKGRITNKEYQELVNTTKKTATRDMIDLVEKEVLDQVGITGKGTYYVLRSQRGHKGDIKGTNDNQFAKGITYKRIKGILEKFVGGRKKGITINHVMGQIKSAVAHAILNIEDGEDIIKQVDMEIKEGRLFPHGPLSKGEMFKRLKEIKRELRKEIPK